ncbi:cysteine hydrolase family protein [Treponema pectinovorum]|uniref:cysteine hydrolase family protein n=1 Tax=Treponema pectinovorum TaxID=164 RepID=UPI0011CA98B3|nr:cysteine hydrolase family protein [Treponema pectinovorum]
MKLIVIDIQKGITNKKLYDFENFIKNTQKIIDAARADKVEVIYFQHDDGVGSGFSKGDVDFEIATEVSPKKNEKVYIKQFNSAFCNKNFADYLAAEKENTLIIVGLQTNFCIDATVKSAFDRGYKVIIPKGTNSTFDNDYMDGQTTYRYYNEMIWPRNFASVISVEETIKLFTE